MLQAFDLSYNLDQLQSNSYQICVALYAELLCIKKAVVHSTKNIIHVFFKYIKLPEEFMHIYLSKPNSRSEEKVCQERYHL